MLQHKFLQIHYEEELTYDEARQWTSGEICLLVLVIVLLVILVVGSIYAWMRYQRHQVYIEYSQNPESGLPKTHISYNQKRKFSQWKINQEPNVNPQVKVTEKENFYGNYYELKFLGKAGINNAVIAQKPIERQKTSYFEIEVEDNPRNTDISIGFCNEKEFNVNLPLGISQTSVGFHSLNGNVYSANKLMYQYKQVHCVYGETLGIGIREQDGRIWLSYNGQFLNPPPPSEIKKEENKKDDEESDEENAKEIQEQEKELIDKKVSVSTKGALYPVITANGPCLINLNIGASTFRMHHKEVQKGLLI